MTVRRTSSRRHYSCIADNADDAEEERRKVELVHIPRSTTTDDLKSLKRVVASTVLAADPRTPLVFITADHDVRLSLAPQRTELGATGTSSLGPKTEDRSARADADCLRCIRCS